MLGIQGVGKQTLNKYNMYWYFHQWTSTKVILLSVHTKYWFDLWAHIIKITSMIWYTPKRTLFYNICISHGTKIYPIPRYMVYITAWCASQYDVHHYTMCITQCISSHLHTNVRCECPCSPLIPFADRTARVRAAGTVVCAHWPASARTHCTAAATAVCAATVTAHAHTWNSLRTVKQWRVYYTYE